MTMFGLFDHSPLLNMEELQREVRQRIIETVCIPPAQLKSEPPKYMIMQPWQYRLMLIEGVKSGHLDYWKTWAKLYNMGYRGKDLQIK